MRVSDEELAGYLKRYQGTINLADNMPECVFLREAGEAAKAVALCSDLRDLRKAAREVCRIIEGDFGWTTDNNNNLWDAKTKLRELAGEGK